MSRAGFYGVLQGFFGVVQGSHFLKGSFFTFLSFAGLWATGLVAGFGPFEALGFEKICLNLIACVAGSRGYGRTPANLNPETHNLEL